MIVGVMSDTHLHSPDVSFTELLKGPLGGAKVLLHAGDHDSASVAEYLEFEDDRPCHSVAGNADPMPLQRTLPRSRLVELMGTRIGIVHGWGPAEGLPERVHALFGQSADIVIFGHSHSPLVRESGGVLLINPGSPFFPRGAPRGTVALIKLGVGPVSVEIVEV